MALDSIYQVRFRQTWGTGGKPLENVFFYNHTAGAGVASDLGDTFNTAVVAAINALQTSQVKNYSIDIINLGNLADFGSFPTLGAGATIGQVLPPHSALSYTCKLNTRAVRKGGHRISGIPEAVNEAGTIVDGTYLGLMDDLRTVMQQELVSADDTWLPVVIKRVKTAVAGTTPTQYTYRLPETDSELVIGEIVTVLVSPNISHQVSREV